MRNRSPSLGITLSLVSGLLLGGVGCSASSHSGTEGSGGATTTSDASSGSGQGGGGGQGGAACVPEAEACDGVDNNCDDVVDEGCACVTGETQGCYTGMPLETRGIGACADGTQTCGTDGQWGACMGDTLPTIETCNGADDDCNGTVDDAIEDIVCGVGACQATVAGCEAGTVPSCVPGQPTIEICDGLDNDCDQVTDESDPQLDSVCVSGIPGICSAGTLQCLSGVLSCVADLMAIGESCDGLDNDCNGTVDDNVPGTGGACSTGFPGVCGPGTVLCSGATIDCVSDIPAAPELCDGLDNNCDGVTDENNPEGGGACATGQLGACANGTIYCQSGALNCIPDAISGLETCNGIDDNCDGQIDEGNPGGGVACGCGGVLQCTAGALTCNGGPIVYFQEDFANNAQGWTLGTEWQIAPAMASSGHSSGCGNGDPATDHTSATADNGVGGVVVGGNASTALHTFYYMESPAFNTAAAPGVYLRFYRWLNSDYTPFMQNTVEVYNGTSWVQVFLTGSTGIKDAAWTQQDYNLTAYKNANMKIRFGFNINSSGVYTCSQWNVDDITVTDVACP